MNYIQNEIDELVKKKKIIKERRNEIKINRNPDDTAEYDTLREELRVINSQVHTLEELKILEEELEFEPDVATLQKLYDEIIEACKHIKDSGDLTQQFCDAYISTIGPQIQEVIKQGFFGGVKTKRRRRSRRQRSRRQRRS